MLQEPIAEPEEPSNMAVVDLPLVSQQSCMLKLEADVNMYTMFVTLDTAPHAAWFVLLLLLLLFMVMMDRRVVDGTRMRQAKGIDGEDTNERHPRVALLTIPTGDILIEGVGAEEHAFHGRHTRYCPPCRVVRVVVVVGVVVVVVVHDDNGSPCG